MVYVTACFTVCWMPLYLNVVFKKLTVREITFFTWSNGDLKK